MARRSKRQAETADEVCLDKAEKATHWLWMWSLLQKCDDDTNLLKDACRSMETTAMQIFANHGWRFSNRIAA
ncbi:hypothetical protein PVAP13_2KG588201 [Panicum virgatum]|uniref:Uncharacterized protein n=1 Tax=Panicum virgatum TaxID=38727 RepID=A0A8T0WHS4_PANVG|nr:hypothetical protein PVAP13_2KG588201 [Panicum virgatum]